MTQTQYRDNIAPFGVGQRIHAKVGDVDSLTNKHPQQKKIQQVTVDTASNDTTYTVTVENVDVSIVSGDAATKKGIRDALVAAINGERLVSGKVVAEEDPNNDDILTITSRQENQPDFQFSETDNNLSNAETQAPKDADPVPFGRGLEAHGDKLGRLLDATNLTARQLKLTLDGYTAGGHTVVLEVNGETYVAETTDGGDVDTVLGALQSALDGATDLVDVTTDTAPNPSELLITAETAGFVDFRVTGLEASGQDWTLTVNEAGDDINGLFAGAAMAGGKRLVEPEVDGVRYQPNSPINALTNGGRIGVEPEAEPSMGDPVYVRLSANGSLDKLGGFRPSWDSGCVPLEGGRWYKIPNSNQAVLELP